MIPHDFILLALLFNLLGTVSYLYKLTRNEIQSHAVTWSLWALAPLVAFVSQVGDGVGLPCLVTLVAGVNPAVVVVLLLVRGEANWTVTPFDVFCGALSFVGLGLWVVFREAEFAVALSVASDALASIPTYRKAILSPRSETWINYSCLALSAVITLATIRTWTFSRYGFLVYLALLGVTLATIVLFGDLRERRAGRVHHLRRRRPRAVAFDRTVNRKA